MKKVYGVVVLVCIYFLGWYLYRSSGVLKTGEKKIIGPQDSIIGGLMFGMKEEEANPLIDELNSPQENERFIDKFQYDRIVPDYDNDSGLYKVRIYGMENNKMANDTAILEELYGLKYGAVDTVSSVYYIRPREDNSPFYFNNVRTWRVGKKSIVIQEVVKDTVRRVDVIIYRRAIENSIIDDKEKEELKLDSIQKAPQLRMKY